MKLAAYRREVDALTVEADRKAADTRQAKVRLHNWKQQKLGTLEASAWFFAAGAFWAGTRRRVSEKKSSRSGNVLRLANTILIASRLASAAMPSGSAVADTGIDTGGVA